MSIHIQSAKQKGSQKWIQKLVNECPNLLNQKIRDQLKVKWNIKWKSPLKRKEYAEYRDEDFLKALGLKHLISSLTAFWPPFGPQWDGLGTAKPNYVFLLEAKSHVKEIVSSPTGAKDRESLEKIRKSLRETKEYVRSASVADWSSYFYQYTNRLAHLYFLRTLQKVEAYLIFLYFIGDKIGSTRGPQTKEEWLSALEVMKVYLGVNKKHRLNKYILDVFIHVEDIERECKNSP
jgi:hypothetical protein